MPPAGSAAQEAQQVLGEGVEIVSAFQNISYEHLIEGMSRWNAMCWYAARARPPAPG